MNELFRGAFRNDYKFLKSTCSHYYKILLTVVTTHRLSRAKIIIQYTSKSFFRDRMISKSAYKLLLVSIYIFA